MYQLTTWIHISLKCYTLHSCQKDVSSWLQMRSNIFKTYLICNNHWVNSIISSLSNWRWLYELVWLLYQIKCLPYNGSVLSCESSKYKYVSDLTSLITCIQIILHRNNLTKPDIPQVIERLIDILMIALRLQHPNI